ncbi:MAG: Apolipoprotein A1/A4/E domain [Idiomarinaceae bacterium HL-53]|nr:MAG: Apolipoprotein A1/A4/E domain [Idiomarinaceae bacterium HL-53]CUS49192.1 hypothetical protein Ga0003345_2179 [Idiomarinaceae bacterium HL-53]
MDNEKQIELTWLLPDLSQLGFPPQTVEELSSVFVVTLWAITFIASLIFLWKFVRTRSRLKWFSRILEGLTREDVAKKRIDLLNEAKKRDKDIGFLWMEFDETLVEIQRGDVVEVRNTLDAGHFFNSYSLAAGVIENRLVAAVPGFLTALGVIGTFAGLQLGLSQLQLGADVGVAVMQDGVAGVVDGAKVAFLTSVWGVALSVFFNFGEKWLEQKTRKRIRAIENKVDWLFPRIRPEEQLQLISENSVESREVLQGLAEKIGEKMQEAMLTATQGIQTSLEASLSEIMAPAINKLVDETSQGNQKALEGLLESFMEGFGQAGNQQRVALDDVSARVNQSVESMQATMSGFVEQLQKTQAESRERERALIADISNQIHSLSSVSEATHKKLSSFIEEQIGEMSLQMKSREEAAAQRDTALVSTIKTQVDELISNSRKQGETLTKFVETQLSGLAKAIDEREHRSNEIERVRNEKIESQSKALSTLSSEILQSVEHSVTEQVNTVKQLIAQGQTLQNSINSSVEASAQAAQAMRESSSELRISADNMKLLSSHVNEAGNKLSGAIKEAVESTSDLANQNQMSAQRMESLRNELLSDVTRFSELTEQLNGLIQRTSTTFSDLKVTQKEFIGELKGEVESLNRKMTQMLEDYAEQANGQTTEHLRVWSQSVTDYSTQMNSAIKALSSVVDEMQSKLG